MAFVPQVDKTMALIMLVINVFLPGIGTIIAAVLDDSNMTKILIGVAQFILAMFLIGWLWAIVWGIFMLQKA